MKQLSIVVLILFIASCATMFNGRYQKIEILTKGNDKVLIDGAEPEIKEDMYLVRRDGEPKQITIQSENGIDQNMVIFQYRTSPLIALNILQGGLCFIGFGIDINSKNTKNYPKYIDLSKPAPLLSDKSDSSKNIIVNDVIFDISEDDILHRNFYSYKNYIRYKDVERPTNKSDQKIKVKNTVFSIGLNELLSAKGYSDTSNQILDANYANNLIINSTIKNMTIHSVTQNYSAGYDYNTRTTRNSINSGFVYFDLEIEWGIIDYYNKTIYKKKTFSTSDQFAILENKLMKKAVFNGIKNALEYGFVEFINSEKVQFHLNDFSNLEVESKLLSEKIVIPKAEKYVTNLPEAIKSTLTVKTKDGHGSGFIISENGYLLTNYHVIADATDISIILNDGTIHETKIIRSSKIHDLALLKIEGTDFLPIILQDSADIEIAQEIYAVGTPTSEELYQTISRGIISGIRVRKDSSVFIQTDASVNGGNSGGPLVTKSGIAIGIVTSKLEGDNIEGVAFAIPSNSIFNKLNLIME